MLPTALVLLDVEPGQTATTPRYADWLHGAHYFAPEAARVAAEHFFRWSILANYCVDVAIIARSWASPLLHSY